MDLVTLSRLQFAVTALYHFLFVPLTLGLSILLGIMEAVYVMTGRQIWRYAALCIMRNDKDQHCEAQRVHLRMVTVICKPGPILESKDQQTRAACRFSPIEFRILPQLLAN